MDKLVCPCPTYSKEEIERIFKAITLNEERNIRDALESVKWADERVTQELAREIQDILGRGGDCG